MSEVHGTTSAAQLSAAWWKEQIAAQQHKVNAALAAVTASDIYQAYMQELGALNWLKRQQEAANGQEDES